MVGWIIVIAVPLTILGVGWWFYNKVTAPTVYVVQPKNWCYTPCKMRTTWSERIRSDNPVQVKYEGKDWLPISGVGGDEIPADKFAPGLAEFKSDNPANPKVAVYIYPPL